jgi:hypothetical protein
VSEEQYREIMGAIADMQTTLDVLDLRAERALGRMLDAAENAAAELERLRLLKESELGVRVVHNPDPNVVKVETTEE